MQPPFFTPMEKFGDERLAPQPAFQIVQTGAGLDRYWFLTEDGTRLIQIQKDWFIINWRKVRGDETYPRYERELRRTFEAEWGRFKKFVSDRDLGLIEPQQCEVTYVNDIVKGAGWDTFAQSLELFSFWAGQGRSGFLPDPEVFNIAASFLMPEARGRLHVVTQHILRRIDQREAVQLRLTARGRPESGDDVDVLAWLDLGREWIVRGFADLTSIKGDGLWKRLQ
jgi:uncharacterized protein (TIGR04255 family)